MIWTQLSFSFVSSLFPLTCLSMAIWALVSSYRIRIREKCFQTSSAHKANDLSSDASNTIELWCFLQNNLAVYWDSGWVGAVRPLMLPTASLLYSCHWPPVVVHDWPLQTHVSTQGQDRGACPSLLIHHGKCQCREMACQAKEAFWLILSCGGCTKPLKLAQNILRDQPY